MQAAATAIALAAVTATASAQVPNACVDAGRAAEADTNLPPGLLLAVGHVESGRWDPQVRRVLPWPWVIDASGQPHFFADKSAAVEATKILLQAGRRNIDVGCFQISLLHHPFAFTNLDQAFDPTANARYAAHFLVLLHDRYGSWSDAVAAYHSADPALGAAYRNLVFAAWHPAEDDSVMLLAAPVASVHVWTPGRPASAPQVVRIGIPPNRDALPRVITPAG